MFKFKMADGHHIEKQHFWWQLCSLLSDLWRAMWSFSKFGNPRCQMAAIL